MSSRRRFTLLMVAIAAHILSAGSLVAQVRGRCGCSLGLRGGVARYSNDVTRHSFAPSVAIAFRDNAFITTEYELAFVNYHLATGRTVPTLGFGSQVQFAAPLRPVAPYVGIGAGTVIGVGRYTGGRARFEGSASASAGVRVQVSGSWSLHVDLRRYWAKESVSSTTDLFSVGLDKRI